MINTLIRLLRFIVLPLIIYLIYLDGIVPSFIAITLLALNVISHLLEKKEKGKVRSFLHPISNKIITLGLLLTFVIRGSFSIFFFSFFIFRDILMGIIRLMASRDDVHLKGKKDSDFLTYSEAGIVFGLLITEFVKLDSGDRTWLQIAHWGTNFFIFISLAVALFFLVAHSITYIRSVRRKRKYGRELKQEEMVILANRRSRGYKDRYRRRLLKVFAKRREAPLVYLPHNEDMFQNSEKEFKDYKQVIIAGGDGTFESALNYSPLKKKSLGFFPLGAGNAFYSYFYKGNRFEYLRSRFKFRETELDVLEVEWEKGKRSKGKRETLFVAIGIDAEVARLCGNKVNRTKNGLFDYIAASWRALLRSKADYQLDCYINGRKYYWDNCVNLTLGKVPYYGFGVRSLVRKINPQDGLVSGLACINTHSHFLNKPIRLWSLLLGALDIDHSPLLPLKAKEFVIKSEVPFPLQAGGEFLDYTREVKVKVKRRQKVLTI